MPDLVERYKQKNMNGSTRFVVREVWPPKSENSPEGLFRNQKRKEKLKQEGNSMNGKIRRIVELDSGKIIKYKVRREGNAIFIE